MSREVSKVSKISDIIACIYQCMYGSKKIVANVWQIGEEAETKT